MPKMFLLRKNSGTRKWNVDHGSENMITRTARFSISSSVTNNEHRDSAAYFKQNRCFFIYLITTDAVQKETVKHKRTFF